MADYTLPPVPTDPTNPLILRQWLFEVFKKQVTLLDSASFAAGLVVADESSDTTCFPLFVTAATGNLAGKTGDNLTFNSDTGLLAVTGEITGTGFTGTLDGILGGGTPAAATATTVDAQTEILLTERAAHSFTPVATRGIIWLRNDASPNKLIFTDDDGTDHVLTDTGGGGDVTKVGTTVNNELAVWTGDGTLDSDPKLTFDDTTLAVNGEVTATGFTGTLDGILGGGAAAAATVTTLTASTSVDTPFMLQGEASAATDPGAAHGKWWVKDDAPTTPMFTDDTDVDYHIGAGLVTFPATQVVSSDVNTLDDYEEGSWTPVLADFDSNATMDVQYGRYYKIGNTVHFHCTLSTSDITGESGAVLVSGLPFTSDSTASSHVPVSIGYAVNLNLTAGFNLGGFVQNNATHIQLYVWDAAAGVTALDAAEWSADGLAIISGTYYTTAQ